MLSAATKASLETKLAQLEQKSTIQLVVATVKDLGDGDVESYANALFRHWKLGQAAKNNGVLFLVAPNQHRMRIEVGYGLEGTLTDATSKLIIANAAAPRFKKGDYDGGVTRAVEDIITALTTDAAEWKPSLKPQTPAESNDADLVFPLVFFLFILFMIAFLSRRSRRTGGAWIVPTSSGGGWSSGGGGGWSSGGGSSDSGFSGGGGSSGGGGASGDW